MLRKKSAVRSCVAPDGTFDFRDRQYGQGPSSWIASVKVVEIGGAAEVAIVQAALDGKVMAGAASVVSSSAMASTCM